MPHAYGCYCGAYTCVCDRRQYSQYYGIISGITVVRPQEVKSNCSEECGLVDVLVWGVRLLSYLLNLPRQSFSVSSFSPM